MRLRGVLNVMGARASNESPVPEDSAMRMAWMLAVVCAVGSAAACARAAKSMGAERSPPGVRAMEPARPPARDMAAQASKGEGARVAGPVPAPRSEEHTSELQSLA